jgi:hypothetical protein
MRFKVKPQPCYWDRKTVIRFAYFPTRIENTIIWLEKYECTYRYTNDPFSKWPFWGYNYWEVVDKKLLNKQD